MGKTVAAHCDVHKRDVKNAMCQKANHDMSDLTGKVKCTRDVIKVKVVDMVPVLCRPSIRQHPQRRVKLND